MKKNCIAVTAHHFSSKTVEILRTLAAQCGDAHDIVLIFDNTTRAYQPTLFSGVRTHLFDLVSLGCQYDLHACSKRGGIIPGNCVFPFLDFMRRNLYETVWCLEYDVWFTGNWRTLFDCFEHNRAGLLATTLRTPETHPHWFWWNSLVAPVAARGDYRRLGAYIPVFRLTREAADGLEDAYAAGWRGHTEVAVPTIIDHLGLGVEDIATVSETNPGISRFYENSLGQPRLSPGTFVCPPAEFAPVYRENFLYHPVKSTDDIARIMKLREAATTAASPLC